MILNDEQKAMLEGKYGEGAAYAMKIQVGIGECFDAQRMVPIKRAHVALSNQDGDLWFAEKLVKAGARFRVAPTLNPGFCTGHFTGACAHPADAEDIAHMIRTDNAYRALGAVLSYNCTPYIATKGSFRRAFFHSETIYKRRKVCYIRKHRSKENFSYE